MPNMAQNGWSGFHEDLAFNEIRFAPRAINTIIMNNSKFKSPEPWKSPFFNYRNKNQ